MVEIYFCFGKQSLIMKRRTDKKENKKVS